MALLVWQAPWIASRFAQQNAPWSASGLYSGVFNWASIQCGFLFAIYTFVLPRSEPFIRAISATSAFANFKRYMLRTVYLTFAIAVATLALMVWNPLPVATGVMPILLAAWVAISVYSFLRFLKCVRSFRKLDRPQ